MLEILIAQSKECKAVASKGFRGPNYRQDFKNAMREAINKARKRLTQ
jgi:hypothetical protein